MSYNVPRNKRGPTVNMRGSGGGGGHSTTPKQTRRATTSSQSPLVCGSTNTTKINRRTDEDYKCGGNENKECLIKQGMDDDWIMCDGCSQWFHITCQELNAAALQCFVSSKRAYVCITCSDDVSGLFKAKGFLKDLGGKVQALQEDINSLKERMEAVEEKNRLQGKFRIQRCCLGTVK